jgi:dTDP-4-dehydrorhamnose reductase
MKILILGHEGMLGRELHHLLSVNHDVTGRDIRDFDIASLEQCINVVGEALPDLVINAAAYTNVDGCESNEWLCMAVNAQGVRNLVQSCQEKNLKIVHFSTDYIFDGSKGEPYLEEDKPSPLNVYGRSKLEGETALRSMYSNYLLIRTAWLYGGKTRNFVVAILEKAKVNKEIQVVDDQIGSPTYVHDLAGAVKYLIEKDIKGTFHVTNRGYCSWYEFASNIIKYAGLRDVSVLPISSERLDRPARRPSFSVLSCRKFMNETGKTMRPWQIALKDYLEEDLRITHRMVS